MMIHTYDKTAATLAGLRHITWAKRVLIYTVTLGLLVQNIAIATASVISASDIQRYVNTQPLFERALQYADYQHSTGDYLERSATSAMTIDGFHQRLKTDYPQILPPKYVTITSGGVPIVAPTYDKPRAIGSPVLQGRYARDQVHALLGINLIDGTSGSGYDSDRNQLNTFYNNTLAMLNSGEIQQAYCVPLNRDRENSGLSDNIIWPECHVIHGERVVVPVVYLTGATVSEYRVDDHRAVLAGTSSFSELTIDNVTVTTGRNSFLQVAGNLLNNQGSIQGNGDLSIVAGGALVNLSGRITSQNNLSIEAALIQSNTLVHRYDFDGRQGGSFGQIATFESDGDLILTSHSDILINGGIANTAGNLVLNAGGSIKIANVQYTDHFSSDSRQTTRSHILQSFLTAEQSMALIAQDQIKIDASEIIAGEHVELLAGLGITVEDELSSNYLARNYYDGGYDINTETFQTVAIRSLIDAGKKVRLHTTLGDVTLRASDVRSTQGAEITAAGGKLRLLTTTETDHYSYSAVKESLFTISTINRGHTAETLAYPTIVGGLEVDALYGLEVEYEGDSTLANDLDAQIASLSQIEGMEWMQELRNDASLNIDWQTASTFYNEWDKDSTSLSPAAIAIITIVVAIFTAGAGAAWAQAAGATANGAIATAASAAYTTLVSTAAIAGANAGVNGGDPLDVFTAGFEAVHSDEGIKSTVTAALTAGVLNGFDYFNAENLSFGEQIQQAVVEASTRSAITTMINGGSFTENIKNTLLQNAANHIGTSMTSLIGDAAAGGNFSDVFRYVAHAGAGCIVGSLSNNTTGSSSSSGQACGAGAFGGIAGQVFADIYDQEVTGDIESLTEKEQEYFAGLYAEGRNSHQVRSIAQSNLNLNRAEINRLAARGAQLGRLTAAIGAALAGLDVDTAANAAADSSSSALRHMGTSLMESLARAEDYNRILGTPVIDISRIEVANQQEVDNALIKQLQLLDIKIESDSTVTYVEEPGEVIRGVYNDDLAQAYIDIAIADKKRDIALGERIEEAEKAFAELSKRLRDERVADTQHRLANAEYRINRLIDELRTLEESRGRAPTREEVIEAVGEHDYDTTMAMIGEFYKTGSWEGFNNAFIGIPGGVIEVAKWAGLDIDIDTPMSDFMYEGVGVYVTNELTETLGVSEEQAGRIIMMSSIVLVGRDAVDMFKAVAELSKYSMRQWRRSRNVGNIDDFINNSLEPRPYSVDGYEFRDLSDLNASHSMDELASFPDFNPNADEILNWEVANFGDGLFSPSHFSYYPDRRNVDSFGLVDANFDHGLSGTCALSCTASVMNHLGDGAFRFNHTDLRDLYRIAREENLLRPDGGARFNDLASFINKRRLDPYMSNFRATAHRNVVPFSPNNPIDQALSQGTPVIASVRMPENMSLAPYLRERSRNPDNPTWSMDHIASQGRAGSHAIIIKSKIILPGGNIRWELHDPTASPDNIISIGNDLFEEIFEGVVVTFSPGR